MAIADRIKFSLRAFATSCNLAVTRRFTIYAGIHRFLNRFKFDKFGNDTTTLSRSARKLKLGVENAAELNEFARTWAHENLLPQLQPPTTTSNSTGNKRRHSAAH